MSEPSVLEKIPFVGSDPYPELGDSLHDVKGDADALALLPYDDETFWMKPAHFDKELIGGKGGYETEDGDKIVLDGNGEAVRSMMGVDIVLAVDPTEHAAAVEPIKALVAYKNNIGEWIKVDKKGNVIEAGDAMEAVNDIDIGPETSDAVQELAQTEDLNFDAAVRKLEIEGEVSKIYDIAPPADVRLDENDEMQIEEASHIAVNQSDAAGLLPTTTSTTELNTALDKARMEEHEEGKLMNYFIYGIVTGSIIVGLVVVVMYLMMSFL